MGLNVDAKEAETKQKHSWFCTLSWIVLWVSKMFILNPHLSTIFPTETSWVKFQYSRSHEKTIRCSEETTSFGYLNQHKECYQLFFCSMCCNEQTPVTKMKSVTPSPPEGTTMQRQAEWHKLTQSHSWLSQNKNKKLYRSNFYSSGSIIHKCWYTQLKKFRF